MDYEEPQNFPTPISQNIGMLNPNDEFKENDSYDNDFMNNNNMGGFGSSNSMKMMNSSNINPMMAMDSSSIMNQIFDSKLNLNDNNYNNIQKVDDNQIVTTNEFKVIFRASGATGQASSPIDVITTPEEKVSELIEKYRMKSGDRDPTKKFIFNAKNLNPSLTCEEAGLTRNVNIFVVATKGIKGAGGVWYMKEINIKFIKISKNSSTNIFNCDLYGLLKLCLLKEISSKLNEDNLKILPEIINCIMRI